MALIEFSQRVEAPMPLPLRYGLFTAVGALLPLEGNVRGAGVTYYPETCGVAHDWSIDCPDESPGPEDKVFDEEPDPTEALPFLVYGSATCGSAGNDAASMEDKARRNLENGEQTQVEQELAVLLTAGSAGLGAAGSTVDAVSQLEQWLYATMDYGRTGFIHTSPGMAAWLQFNGAGLMVRDGNRWRTPYGSIWSIGSGYPADTIWISGEVHVWRADVAVPPVTQIFDRIANQWYALAEREYAVAYDCYANSITFGGA